MMAMQEVALGRWRKAARRAGIGKLLLRCVIQPAQRCWRMRLPDAECLVAVGGLTLEILSPRRNRIGEALYRDGVWEPEVTGAIRALVRPGMTAVDVGADIGYYSVLLASLTGDGRVIAFEPLSVPRQLLERNLQHNNLRNVVVCDYALGRNSSRGWITKPLDLSRLDPNGHATGPDDVPAEIRRFDDIAQDLAIGRVDFMKIDVEGAEHDVLRGAAATLKRDRPLVLVEVHGSLLPLFSTSADDLLTWMQAHGYGWRSIMGDAADRSTTSTILFQPVG